MISLDHPAIVFLKRYGFAVIMLIIIYYLYYFIRLMLVWNTSINLKLKKLNKEIKKKKEELKKARGV